MSHLWQPTRHPTLPPGQDPFKHLARDSDVESMSDGWDEGSAYGYNDVLVRRKTEREPPCPPPVAGEPPRSCGTMGPAHPAHLCKYPATFPWVQGIPQPACRRAPPPRASHRADDRLPFLPPHAPQDDASMGWARYAHSMRIFVFNSGLFYLRPTQAALDLLDKVVHRVETENGWDQALFNECIFFPNSPRNPKVGRAPGRLAGRRARPARLRSSARAGGMGGAAGPAVCSSPPPRRARDNRASGPTVPTTCHLSPPAPFLTPTQGSTTVAIQRRALTPP